MTEKAWIKILNVLFVVLVCDHYELSKPPQRGKQGWFYLKVTLLSLISVILGQATLSIPIRLLRKVM